MDDGSLLGVPECCRKEILRFLGERHQDPVEFLGKSNARGIAVQQGDPRELVQLQVLHRIAVGSPVQLNPIYLPCPAVLRDLQWKRPDAGEQHQDRFPGLHQMEYPLPLRR